MPQIRKSGGLSASVAAGLPSPSLVQMVVSQTTIPGIYGDTNGDNFAFSLPNAVGAGNCLVLMMSYRNGFVPAITDNNGNTWHGSSPDATIVGVNNTSSFFLVPNANSGVTQISVSFGQGTPVFQYKISEWTNIATTSPANGSSGTTATGPTLACGSFTPTTNNNANGGNLVLAYYFNSTNNAGANPTSWVPGGSFSLQDGDLSYVDNQGSPHASMSFVQTTSAAINPTITATGDSTDTYNCVALALKAANAGTAIPAGIHVNKIIHMYTEPKLHIPCTGNLIVITTGFPGATVTDSDGGSWTALGTDSTVLYSVNRAANPNRIITVTSTYSFSFSLRFFDIQGANSAPFDKFVEQLTASNVNTTFSNAPSITPAASNGLVIAWLYLGIGPVNSITSPTGAFYDVINSYTNITDGSAYDNADGVGHYYNPNTTTINWNWNIITQAGGTTAWGGAIAFKV